jgi:hypothetical protein
MRCAIIQYFINPFVYSEPNYKNLQPVQPLTEISKRSFQIYCKKYKIDFIKKTKPKLKYRHPAYERFDLWLSNSWWEKYDQICYVDADVFALPHAPNIFKNYPNLDTFKYCYYSKFRNEKIKNIKNKYKKTLLSTCNPKELKTKGFNSGVFILTKKSAKHMKPWIKLYQKLDHDDNEILNWATIKSKVATTEMDKHYNYKNAYYRGKPLSYFFHAHGYKKKTKLNHLQAWLTSLGLK